MSEWFWKRIEYFVSFFALFVLFVVIYLATQTEIKDADIWLHLASGKYILDHWVIPHMDIFSATMTGHLWINHEWLFQVIMYKVFEMGGPQGLINLQSGVILLTFVLLLILSMKEDTRLISIAGLFFLLMVYQHRFTFRPDIFSILFLTLYIFLFSRYLDRKSIVWIIFVLQVLWVNIHGFFIMGPLLILVFIIAQWIKTNIKFAGEVNSVGLLDNGQAHRINILLGVSILACLLNPYFIKGIIYPIKVLFSIQGDSAVFLKNIKELHHPFYWETFFTDAEFWYLKVMIVVSALGFYLNRRRLDIGLFILWVLFLILGLKASRNIAFLGLIAYLTIVINYPQIQWHRFSYIVFISSKAKIMARISIYLIVIVGMIQYGKQLSAQGYFDFDQLRRKSETEGGFSLRAYPYKAGDFLVNNHVQGNFLNDFNSGSYLIGRASPQIKVFIDGRTEVYGPHYFQEYIKLFSGDMALFEEQVKKYAFTGIFLNYVDEELPFKFIKKIYEHPDWALVYFDYDAVIFLKKTEINNDLINKYRIDLLQWKTKGMDIRQLGAKNVWAFPYISRGTMLLNLDFLEQAKQEAREAVRISPHHAFSYLLEGKICLRMKDYEAAFKHLRHAKLLAPNNSEIRFFLARSLFFIDEYQKAKDQCVYLIKENAEDPSVLYLLALIYAKEKKYKESMLYFKEAFSLAPHNISAAVELSSVLKSEGKTDKARHVLQELLKANPHEALIEKELSAL